MKVHDIRRIKVGQWVRVFWNDVGARDCIIVGKNEYGFMVFEPFSEIRNIDRDQIIAVGDFLEARYANIK
ncbi:MAG: hypothetical protein PHS54_00070 [Clostridia bacterium]|nr:hypothetical protein [Clostridia bacterium]